MFMRNLAAGRSAAESVKQWSGGSAVPALVARMQNLQPPQHILVHILYCLSNLASTGQHASPISTISCFTFLLQTRCCWSKAEDTCQLGSLAEQICACSDNSKGCSKNNSGKSMGQYHSILQAAKRTGMP